MFGGVPQLSLLVVHAPAGLFCCYGFICVTYDSWSWAGTGLGVVYMSMCEISQVRYLISVFI